jgi:hypothetical protein
MVLGVNIGFHQQTLYVDPPVPPPAAVPFVDYDRIAALYPSQRPITRAESGGVGPFRIWTAVRQERTFERT